MKRGPDFAKVVYKYDDKDRVIEKAFFGDDGTPQIVPDVGAAIIRQTYNQKGELVRREFLDGQRHPSPHVQYRRADDQDQGGRRHDRSVLAQRATISR